MTTTTIDKMKVVLSEAQKAVRLNDRIASINTLEDLEKLLGQFIEPKIQSPKTQLACMQSIAESLKRQADIIESQRVVG